MHGTTVKKKRKKKAPLLLSEEISYWLPVELFFKCHHAVDSYTERD